jgi:xylulokinase
VEESSPVLIGIDIGTGSVRALAFDARGRRVAAAARPTPFTIRDTGGEFDPDVIFATALSALKEVGITLAGRPVAGIAAASVGESCVILDEQGRSLAPSIVWHDRRTQAEGFAIEKAIGRDRIFEIIGHSVEPIYTLAKLLWMQKHWPEAFAKARCVLMMADWIAFRLSGEAATDPMLASRTLYFDIRHRCWSEELLGLAGLSTDFPAPLAASGTALGQVRPQVLAETGLAGSPVVAVGGHDHIVGALATGMSEAGSVINSIGTAEALLLATDRPLDDPELLRRGYVQGAIETDRRLTYIAGGLFSGGAFEWMRSIAGSPPQDTLIEEASRAPVGSGGVVFLPYLANSPAPDPDVFGRGAFLGLTQMATPAVLYRAVLEGVALQARLMLDGMTGLRGVGGAEQIRLIGGASRNGLFLEIKANVFARPITVVEEAEATTLGAALMAGVAAGFFPTFDAAWRGVERKEYSVEPEPEAVERYERLRTRVFAKIPERLRPINKAIAELAAK